MEEPEWVAVGEDKNGITINQYFITHPEWYLERWQRCQDHMAWRLPAFRWKGQI